MRRLFFPTLFALTIVSLVSTGGGVLADANARLFPTHLPEREWVQFSAEGFSQPASGLIYRGDRPPCCGMPLGGVGTGCLDIEASGVLGFNALFDALPRRPQLLEPFLGIAVGDDVWLLSSKLMRIGGPLLSCRELRGQRHVWRVNRPLITGVHAANDIHYWGHFPVADLEYETSAPISVGLRAWAPFLPGDAATSNTPGAVFEVHLRNPTSETHRGTLAFAFPSMSQIEAQVPAKMPTESFVIGGRTASRPFVPGGVEGKHVRTRKPLDGVTVIIETGVNYSLGLIPDAANEGITVRTGAGLGAGDWAKIRSQLPAETKKDFGASVAVDFELGSGQTKTLRFVLAWYTPEWHAYAPEWSGEGDKKYPHMYAKRYKSSGEVAEFLARDHASLLSRILGWQEAIYTDRALPVWLRETLVNNLACISEDSYWTVAAPPFLDWCGPDGLFAMNESPRGSPQMECIPCAYYGETPIIYFFPELARNSLRGYVRFMRDDGAVPFIFGKGSELTDPLWEWQKALNGVVFVDLVDRLWLRTGDDDVLKEFYPAVKKNTIYTINLKKGPRGVISMPDGDVGREWYEGEDWHGMVSHAGGLKLSNLWMSERMAKKMGDTEFAAQCREWIDQGSAAMEEHMWTGSYYRLYNQLETGKRSDEIMANQLDGEWANMSHGLPHAFQEDRVHKALDTIKRTCVNEYCGAVGFAHPDGTPQIKSYGIFPPEIMMLGMTYIYAGDHQTGLAMVERLMRDIVCRRGKAFDLPNMLHCDGSDWFNGTDYYQNLMLWSMPAALAKQDLSGPCKSGGLVDRVLQAAKKK